MLNPLRCLLIDDEVAAHYVLQHYVDQVDRLALAGNCYNAIEAINFLHRQPVDLLFLDINMPQMNGLQMLETLTHPPRVILTTAHSEFALESYNYNVVDYLVKPIEFARFLKAVDKVVAAQTEEATQRVSLQTPIPASVVIKVDGDWIRLSYDDLLYGQSWGNYIKLFTTEQVYVTALTMTELEQRLPAEQFVRIHKSYLVSLNKIMRLSGNEVFIGEASLPVGLTYRRELVDRLR